MFAVISIKKESNVPLFHSSKTFRNERMIVFPLERVLRRPFPRCSFPKRLASCDRFRRSIAYHHIRFRCEPSSRNDPNLMDQPERKNVSSRTTKKVSTNPIATRLIIGFRSDLLEDRFDVFPAETSRGVMVTFSGSKSKRDYQAFSLPPGISEGPVRAPSSPPDTPVPMKSRPFSSNSATRRYEKKRTLRRECFRHESLYHRVFVQRISSVDDDVAFLEVWNLNDRRSLEGGRKTVASH